MKALTKRDIIDSDGHLDIYAFMRSSEIREHMRRNKRFNCEDKIFIILKSMNPYSIKLEALRMLYCDNELKTKEKRKVLYLIRYIEKVLKEIYEPEAEVVFVEETFGGKLDKEFIDFDESNDSLCSVSYYGLYQEFCELYKDDYRENDKEPLFGYKFDIVKPGISWENNNPISFSVTWFERRLEIYSLAVDREWALSHSFAKTVAKYLSYEGNTSRYSLPFKSMSRVKILTPFMKRPLYGILDSNMDGNGSWYHFFYPDDKRGIDNIDLSYQFLGLGSNLTVFDWVSSSDDKAPFYVLRELEDQKIQRTYISDIKENEGACLIAKANNIVKIEKMGRRRLRSEVYVEIQDDTGFIVVPIMVNSDDIGWLKNAAKEHTLMRIWTAIKTNEAGELYACDTGDVALLDEEYLN